MLYLIGIGLEDEKDISVKGLEAVKKCQKIYIEDYTSLLQVPFERLESFYGKSIIKAPRQTVENNSPQLIEEAKNQDIAVLIIGDPLSATTHITLMLEAKENNVAVQVIHNASVLTAVGATGLQLYKFGRVASIPFHDSDAPYDILQINKTGGLHSLFLLDLSPKDSKFMSAATAAQILLDLEQKHQKKLISALTVGLAGIRLGTHTQEIHSGPLSQLAKQDFGPGPHCLIIPGELHFMEEEAMKKLAKD